MKWELHMHTSESSPCGRVPAAEGVAAYAEKGYDGVVVTDHFNQYAMEWLGGTDRAHVEKWLRGYRAAKEAGDRLGVRVLFGLEARVPGSENDYLIFGAEPEMVLENPTLYAGELSDVHALCRRYGALLVQAHPSRAGFCTPADAEDLDGAEVFNGNPRHNNENEKTLSWAKAHPRLIQTSGSDFHQMEDLARGGVETNWDVRTSAQLAQMLQSGEYTLLRPEEKA